MVDVNHREGSLAISAHLRVAGPLSGSRSSEDVHRCHARICSDSECWEVACFGTCVDVVHMPRSSPPAHALIKVRKDLLLRANEAIL